MYRGRPGLYDNKYKIIFGDETNFMHRIGSLTDAMRGADVFIGVSVADQVSEEMIRSMASDPIVFALANPVPEIMPEKKEHEQFSSVYLNCHAKKRWI
jgi:malate dehydrogenase (oxaloacetate-decarboxylating)